MGYVEEHSKFILSKILENSDKIVEMISQGESDRTIASFLGIHRETWSRYKCNDEVKEKIVIPGNDEFVLEVEKSAKKLALGKGYRIEKTKIVRKDGIGNIMYIETKTKETQYPASEAHIQFLLTNLAPDRWKVVPEDKIDSSKQVICNENFGDVDLSEYENFKFFSDVIDDVNKSEN
jgi:hypothetical protein